jgi:CysZ protein
LSGNVSYGARYLIRGSKMLTHKSLRLFVIIPLIINITIFASFIGLTVSYLDGIMSDWMDAIPQWLSFIQWLIWPLIAITLSLISGYVFTSIALLIASPFNALLAEKAEELITGRQVDALEGLSAAIMAVPRGIIREIMKLMYYIPLFLVVLILSFIPPINTAAPVLWFLLGAWMMSLQFLDYPMDNHRLRFADVKKAASSVRLTSMGFGGAVALCASIPVINFFVIPSAVVGATLLWCEELQA